jgi:hypothetical protein
MLSQAGNTNMDKLALIFNAVQHHLHLQTEVTFVKAKSKAARTAAKSSRDAVKLK